MGALSRRSFAGPVVLAICLAAAAGAGLWFLSLAIRSFYPVQAGAGEPRVDAAFLTQALLAVVCLAVIVVFVGVGVSVVRGRDKPALMWLVSPLALAAILVALALTAESFIHGAPPLGESPSMYTNEASLWATYFWVMAGGMLALAALVSSVQLARARRSQRSRGDGPAHPGLGS